MATRVKKPDSCLRGRPQTHVVRRECIPVAPDTGGALETFCGVDSGSCASADRH